MRGWWISRNMSTVLIASLVAMGGTIIFGSALVGLPAVVFSVSALPLSLFCALPLMCVLPVSFDSSRMRDVVAVRDMRRIDMLAFGMIGILLFAFGLSVIPFCAFAGICMALTVVGCSSLGIAASRKWGRKVGASVPVGYVFVCSIVGYDAPEAPAFWQFPIAVVPSLAQMVMVLGCVAIMLWTPVKVQ